MSSLFNENVLSKNQSQELLLDIRIELKKVPDILLILSTMKDYYKNTLKKVVIMMVSDLELGKSVEDVFLKYKLINKDEYLILKRAKSLKHAVNLILNFRKTSSIFNKVSRGLFMPLGIAILVGLIVLIVSTPHVLDMLKEVGEIIKMRNKYTPEFKIPFFMKDVKFVYGILSVYIVIVISAIYYIFYYLDNNNIRQLYKMFPLKFYDDFIKYFIIADSMKKVGASSYQIFEDLALNAKPGLRPIFKKMYEKGDNYAEILEMYNAPIKILNTIKREERDSKFWANLNIEDKDSEELGLVQYMEEIRFNKKEMYIKYFGKTLLYLAILVGTMISITPIIVFMINAFAFTRT